MVECGCHALGVVIVTKWRVVNLSCCLSGIIIKC